MLRPDHVVLLKAMGNGVPISGLVGRGDLMEAFGRDVRYFNTFGGNPVSIAAATAVLDELESRGLLPNAEAVGDELAARLREATADDDGVAGVRQAGLFLAVELVTDRGTSTPDAARAAAVVDRMRDLRVLISASGTYDNVLKIRPPLAFTGTHVPRLLEAFTTALEGSRAPA